MPPTTASYRLVQDASETGFSASPLTKSNSMPATLEQRYGWLLPAPLRRRWMIVEAAIEREITAFADALPSGSRVLDAGAGEGRHRDLFRSCRYVGVDLGVGDVRWNYSGLDACADLAQLPFRDQVFDAVVNIVVLEHTRQPQRVVAELARAMKPGGRLLLVAPHEWELHQMPHDYFRFTRFGLEWLLREAGLTPLRLEPIGGYFTLLARRILNGLNFFQGGLRWAAFPFAATVAGVCGLVLPSLDFLDRDKHFTLAYVCLAEKK